MESGILNNLDFSDDDSVLPSLEGDKPSRVRVSPFTILVDSNEKYPFSFDNIIGDSVDAHAVINVRTERKRLKTGDYQLKGFPSGITIERKSKADLFASVHPGQRRDDFIERLGRMEREFQNSVVLIDCYPNSLYENPIEFGSLNPKMVYRTTLSWGLQFPGTHWMWAADRETAAQVAYRILEKWYQHETDVKYHHHNKPIENAISAFDEGCVARRYAAGMEKPQMAAPYRFGSPLDLQWRRGWSVTSARYYGGDLGLLHDGPVPEAGGPPKAKQRRRPKSSDPSAEAKSFFGTSLK